MHTVLKSELGNAHLEVGHMGQHTLLLENGVSEVSELLMIKPPIQVYGKEVNQQRDVGFFSNTSSGYRYSGQLAQAIPLTKSTKLLLELINEQFNAEYNGILINRYVGGDNYLCAHSDDESNLDKIGVVALSYGVTRNFRVREK